MACYCHAHDCRSQYCRFYKNGKPRPPVRCDYCGKAFWRGKVKYRKTPHGSPWND